MSGGHYDYAYFKIEQLADEIVNELEEALQPEKFDNQYGYSENGCIIENLGKDSKARPIVERIAKDLHRIAKEAKEVEWLMSGDTSVETFLKRMGEL